MLHNLKHFIQILIAQCHDALMVCTMFHSKAAIVSKYSAIQSTNVCARQARVATCKGEARASTGVVYDFECHNGTHMVQNLRNILLTIVLALLDD